MHWLVPFTRNKRFFGRSDQLGQLETSLFNQGSCDRVAIMGLGGVGKTQIVLELAYRTRENHPDCSVFWIHAASMDTFEHAYREIGRLLQIPAIDDQKTDVKQLVMHSLSQESAGQWLLIIDNADDIGLWSKCNGNSSNTVLIDFIPRIGNGSIVFTTRNRKAAVQMAYSNVLEVTEMDEDAATEVFKRYLIHPELMENDQSAKNLLKKLAFLPLAIAQAAAYINTNGISVAEYLSLFKGTEEHIIEVLSKDFTDEGRYKESKNPIATTWLISFEHIWRYNQQAAELLSFMACLEPTNIPRRLLPPAESPLQDIEAIGTLTAYLFVAKRPCDHGSDTQPFDLHPLVHLAMRNWLKEKNMFLSWNRKTVGRLEELFPIPNYDNKAIWETYLPHARYILTSTLSSEGVTEKLLLLEKVGQCQLIEGKYSESWESHVIVMELREKMLGVDHLDTLRSASNVAEALANQGKYAQAEQLSRRAAEGRKRLLGREHTDALISMNILASIHWYQGRWTEAEELYREVMDIRITVLGQEHPDTLITMFDLASTYSSQGLWTKAEELEVQVIETRARVLGQEHPDTLSSMANLAVTYRNQGRLKEAEELGVQVMETRARVLGQEHPYTLTSINNLAATYRNQGRWKEAEELEVQL